MSTIPPSPAVYLSTDDSRSVVLRMQTAVRRAALTHQLAHGEDPAATAQLRLRAHQLTSARTRSALADGLRGVIREAQQPLWHQGFSVVNRRSVLGAVQEIDLLVKRLHSPEPVTAQGIALVTQLLTDGASSPLYGSADPGILRRAVIVDTAALDPPGAGVTTSVHARLAQPNRPRPEEDSIRGRRYWDR